MTGLRTIRRRNRKRSSRRRGVSATRGRRCVRRQTTAGHYRARYLRVRRNRDEWKRYANQLKARVRKRNERVEALLVALRKVARLSCLKGSPTCRQKRLPERERCAVCRARDAVA